MKEPDFKFKDIVEFAKDVIIVTKSYPIDEPGPEIVYVNRAFTALTGYSQEEVLGKSPRILQSNETDEEAKKSIRTGLEQQDPVRVTIKNFSKAGEEYWLDLSVLPLKNDQGVVSHFVAIERDVTQQKNIESRLEVLSRTDALTGLLNRRSFDEILESELSQFKRTGDVYSLLMLDIDHFKLINDNYGHPTGDDAIQAIAKSCKSNLRLHDKIARVGGEEFCVLLPNTDKRTAFAIAEKLRAVVANTSLVAITGNFSMTVSIGVSEVDVSDIDYMSIFRRADDSLYDAKRQGRDRVSM